MNDFVTESVSGMEPATGTSLGLPAANILPLTATRKCPDHCVNSLGMNLGSMRLALLLSLVLQLSCGWFQPVQAAGQVVMRFVDNPHASSQVVRLGDLVEVLSGNSPSLEKMMDLPLGPAPRENAPQTWLSQDVLQHLELRGIHPASIRWSGATQCQLQRIASAGGKALDSMTPAFLKERAVTQAENLVSQAIGEYLTLHTGERTDWRIEVHVPNTRVPALQSRRHIVSIGGGKEPWEGDQEFVLQVKDRGTIIPVSVKARVALPPMIVATTRPMRRDEIITESAITYRPLPKRWAADESKYFTQFEQVLGKQLRRSLSTGLPISEGVIGEPVVISRGELIEVESVAGGVSVRTQGKSLGSGSVGELIEVEILGSRHRQHATVVGPLKVRIAAVAARGAAIR